MEISIGGKQLPSYQEAKAKQNTPNITIGGKALEVPKVITPATSIPTIGWNTVQPNQSTGIQTGVSIGGKALEVPKVITPATSIPTIGTTTPAPTITAGGFRSSNTPKQTTTTTPEQTATTTPAPTITAGGFRSSNAPKQTATTTPKQTTTTTPAPTIPKETLDATRAKNAEIRARIEAGQQKYETEKQANIEKKQEQVASSTPFGSRGMLDLNDQQIAGKKMEEVTGLKQSDLASNVADKERTLQTGAKALEDFRNVVGIDKDGNVDMNRKGSIGATLQTDFNDFKKNQEALSSQYESSRKARVTSQVRASLLARGIDVSNISQEKLIGLSDEVGAKAFSDIYDNKQNTLNLLTNKQEALTSRLNDLREKGLLAEDKYNALKATVESQFEKTKNDIQRNYVNDIFGITDTAQAKKEAKQTNAINTMENMLKAVPATVAPELRTRFMALVEKGKNVSDIIKAIGNDQNYKEWAKKMAEETKKQANEKIDLENRVKESEITKNINTGEAALINAKKPRASSTTPKGDARPVSVSSLKAVMDKIEARPFVTPGLTEGEAKALLIKYN